MANLMWLSIYCAYTYVAISYAYEEFLSEAILKVVSDPVVKAPLELDVSFKICGNVNSSYEFWFNLPGFSKLRTTDMNVMPNIFGIPSNTYSFDWVRV